jgi:hypothetical protein
MSLFEQDLIRVKFLLPLGAVGLSRYSRFSACLLVKHAIVPTSAQWSFLRGCGGGNSVVQIDEDFPILRVSVV